MQAHANDLRDEVANDWASLVYEPGDEAPAAADLDRFVHRAASDWRRCGCTPAVAALLDFSEKVTRTPEEINREDLDGLRRVGWSDAAIHDAVQVVAYFNYINRIADALGVDPEDHAPIWGSAE